GPFDTETYHIDIRLADGHLTGESKVRGVVNGFGFDATSTFTARPVIQNNRVQLADVHINDPSVDIDLPWYLEWATGILVGVLGGPVLGVLSVVLLNILADALGQGLIPQEELDKKRDQLKAAGQNLPVPANLYFGKVTVTPTRLDADGSWFVRIDDPAQFVQGLRINAGQKREKANIFLEQPHEFWVSCMAILGTVVISPPGEGSRFEYSHDGWSTVLTLTPQPINLPLPLTYHQWTIHVGYREPTHYRLPNLGLTPYPLAAGPLTVTSDVWLPQPVFNGTVVNRTVALVVSGDSSAWRLAIPPDAANMLIQVEVTAVDALGQQWQAETVVDVANETVKFDADFEAFQKYCAGKRKTLVFGREPEAIDPLWNPPDAFFDRIQHAARTNDPYLLANVADTVQEHGLAQLVALLNPEQLQHPR
ncbi:MAG: hypothetical protein M3308_01885, partial [Actinomycetota bacterium]|nr:hypothetical protein [Actinomycetota bacterium]